MQLKDEVKRLKAEEQLRLKKMQWFSKRKQWRQQVKRTQHYLGFSIPTAGSMEVSDKSALKASRMSVELMELTD